MSESEVRFFRVRNFEKFQHYKDRRPPWIKLYRDLFSDPNFFELSEKHRYFLIALFIVASQNDNRIPLKQSWLRRELCTTKPVPIERLIELNWLEWIPGNASEVLAERKQLASEVLVLPRDRDRDRDREEENTTYSLAPDDAAASPPHVGVFLNLPLNTGSEFSITQKHISEWRGLYPAVDPEQEVRSMRGWLMANPQNRKTKSGILRFCNSWLSRAQNQTKAHPNGNHKSTNSTKAHIHSEKCKDFGFCPEEIQS